MVKQADLDRMYMKMAYDATEISYARRRKVGAILVLPDEGRFEGVNGMPSGFENNCENHGDVICEHIWSQIVTHHPWADGAYTCTKCNKQADSIEPDFGYEYKLITKPECLHAESNAIMKVARSHASSIGGTMYCTLSPCLECAKLIIQAGIIRVVYSEQYPYPGHTGDSRAIGLDLLRKAKIRVDQLDLSNEKVV